MDFPKWAGKCEACGEWNSLKEMRVSSKSARAATKAEAGPAPQSFSKISTSEKGRIATSLDEFDRVLGGGFIPGAVTLLGGDPGIGKSTLVLQVCGKICASNLKQKVLYISGEESAEQIKSRADRLKIETNNLLFSGETETSAITQTLERERPGFVVIDSIQTVFNEQIDSAPGSISQVKESTFAFTEAAKKLAIPILIIGHVTKEGAVAGPRLLEHMVDTVLYLEGDRYHSYRVLRGVKNRFGSTNETGIFEMAAEGLKEVINPSSIFLAERKESEPGSVITAIIEGTRPFLVEIQGLTSRTVFGYPKRTSSGIDLNRLHVLLAVLDRKAKLSLANQDVYVNVVGGMGVREPAADLACLTAVASSLLKKTFLPQTVVFGEVGLSGEIRSVGQVDKRISEATKLGFKKIILPNSNVPTTKTKGVELIPVQTVNEVLKKALLS